MGTSSDGKGNAIYAPSASGQMKALRNAYQLAGVTPDTIEMVEGHGTGTKVGDTVEATALSTVYGKHTERPVGPSIQSKLKQHQPRPSASDSKRK